MRLTSNTGLVAAAVPEKNAILVKQKSNVELRCEVTPAPFILRPYAGLYNPFSHACSVLCNHPADSGARECVKKAKESACLEGKAHYFQEDLSKFQNAEKEKNRTPHDIVTEDMFRRYTETDSRPLTPAPTLASGKSRGSRRCLTPDQTHQKTTIVVDLRRSHSQETLYYHGYTSDVTGGQTSGTLDRSTLPSLNLSDATHGRLLKGHCQQLPPLASPLVLSKRTLPHKDLRVKKSQLKALNVGKLVKKSNKSDVPATQRSKAEKEAAGEEETGFNNVDEGGGGEGRRRGKRRRKGRVASDRLTSAGLAAQQHQDPETQVAGIGTDSQNPSSRGSVAAPSEDIVILPVIKSGKANKKTDSFLNDEILKYLHREVDEEAIETEFDKKRRYVLEEALRTRPDRPYGEEMQALVRSLRVPAVSLGEWLHVPRAFCRRHAHFGLPIDTAALQTLTPMNYAARFVTIKKSKQLLYLTVLRKFRPKGYQMPVKDLKQGLVLMMGGTLSMEQADQFEKIMLWNDYEEEENFPDDIKLTLDTGYRKLNIMEEGDTGQANGKTIKYRTWCGVCAICERMYGRYPPREKDPPEGMEVSDFSMLETKIAVLKVHSGLVNILNAIRLR